MASVAAPNTPTELDDFVALSAILTGIAGDKLHPALDTFGTAAEYLAYAKAHDSGGAFAQLMIFFAKNRTQPDVGALILANEEIAWMARTVMLMWYLGAWYDPAGLQAYHADPVHNFASFVVISSNAYTQGWVWPVGQTHPMGYSTWRFGYWNSPPQPLSAFIGGN